MKPPSRTAVEARYRDIRHAALGKAEELARAAFIPTQVSLTAIDRAATAASEEHWQSHASRRYPWPWGGMPWRKWRLVR